MRFVPLLAALVFAAPVWAQTTAYQQSFEDGDPAYTASLVCNDGDNDFFTRTDLSDVSASYVITGIDGSFIFAAQDIDDGTDCAGTGNLPQRISFDDIDISGLTNLAFAGLFAEDDATDAAEDWDAPDYVHVMYRIDSDDDADLLPLLWFENDGSTFNSAPLQDTDFDGTGDGTALTSVLTEFTANIAGTGSTLDIVILFSLDSGDEDIALDNVRITGEETTTPAPEIDVMPLSVDFGIVETGSVSMMDVTIENTGDAPLTLSNVFTSGDPFFIQGTPPTTVAAGDTETLILNFSPSSAGTFNGSLTIQSNDADEPTVVVTLTGAGEDPVVLEPEIDVTPTSLAFGTVETGSSSMMDVTISNTGDAVLNISGLTISGDPFFLSGAFPSSVDPGGSETVTVAFSPSTAGPFSGSLTIESDDSDEPSVIVSLSGTGEDPVVLEPEIDVTPTSLAFGTVTVGSSAQMMATIANTGDATLTLSSVTVSGSGFSLVGPAPTSVAAGSSVMVTVQFAPASAGAASGTLAIQSNDADEPTVNVSLSGTGEEPTTGTCDYEFDSIATSGLILPSSGGATQFAFAIDNSGNASAVSVDIWAMVTDGSGNVFIRTPRMPTVAANSFYKAGYRQNIPASTPDGTYTFTLFAGTFNDADPSASDVCGSDAYTIVKGATPTLGKASPLVAEDWSDVTIENEEITPAAFLVSGEEVRVGPNPTRGTATFGFALAADDDVTLAVYDVQGRTVATVVEGRMEAGAHTATMTEALAPGVYVWQLRAGSRVETGRLTVVR